MSVDQAGAEFDTSLFYTTELDEQTVEKTEQETDEEETGVEEPDDGSPETEEELYKVTVDGEEAEVTLEQMRDSFAGVAAIQKGLRENSEDRKSLAKERALLSEDSDIILGEDVDFLESELIQELKLDNRDLYDAIYDNIKSRVDRLKTLKERQAKENETLSKEDIEEKRQELLTLIPEWLNQKKAQEEGQLAEKRIKEIGYTDDEIKGITDPRIVALARDAALYRKIMTAKPGKKEVKKTPKSAKPGAGEKQEKEQSFADKFYS